MINLSHLVSCFNLITWQPWLFGFGAVIVTAVAAFTVFKTKVKKLTHDNNVLNQRIVECNELLCYAKENEQKTKGEVEASSRAKGLLLAKLSHEIRTPMNGVIGMASLLSETDLTDEQKEYTELIIESSEKLMTSINNMLVNDVISYSQNGTHKTELEEKDYDLRNNIESVLESFATKATQTGVELIYALDKNVPELLVGDELRLRQVLMNLVENSFRFTIGGEILIAVTLIKILEGNQADVAFEVRDSGTGMPAHEIEMLSKDITDINITNDSNALSLLICKKLVGLMGGKLEVETKHGAGSGTVITFRIRTRVSLQPQRQTPKFNTSIRNKNILLVDDNYTSRSMLKLQLEQWNLLPDAVASAKEAIELINKNRFDIVITDLEMPQMNGIELAQAIKQVDQKTSLLLLNTNGDERYRDYPGLFKSVLSKPVKQYMLYKYLSYELNRIDAVIEIQPDKPKVLSDLGKQYPLRILVAEDNKTNQDVALKILKKLGYDATLAENGEEALEMVGEGNFDIIFMDIQMPVKDGLETTRMIRLCLNTQPVIIAMTANAIQGDKQKCLNAGMDDYISKPFRIEELTKMIEKWATQIKVK